MGAKERKDAANEVKVLSSLKHPYIVAYKDSFIEDGFLNIVMEYADGGDLFTRIQKAKKSMTKFPEQQILRWFTQALLALKFIHDKHILHRDLKSQNFFLMSNGKLKIGDFGIAKVLDNTAACAQTTIGTPYYLSPEICQERPYSWASDMWSLGCVLYECCCLKVPFDASNLRQLIDRITRAHAASRRELLARAAGAGPGAARAQLPEAPVRGGDPAAPDRAGRDPPHAPGGAGREGALRWPEGRRHVHGGGLARAAARERGRRRRAAGRPRLAGHGAFRRGAGAADHRGPARRPSAGAPSHGAAAGRSHAVPDRRARRVPVGVAEALDPGHHHGHGPPRGRPGGCEAELVDRDRRPGGQDPPAARPGHAGGRVRALREGRPRGVQVGHAQELGAGGGAGRGREERCDPARREARVLARAARDRGQGAAAEARHAPGQRPHAEPRAPTRRLPGAGTVGGAPRHCRPAASDPEQAVLH